MGALSALKAADVDMCAGNPPILFLEFQMSQKLSIKDAVIGFDGDANVLYYEWQPNLSVDSQISHP